MQVLKTWESSFSALMADADGVKLFEEFLNSEFSEENLLFYKACDEYKKLPEHMLMERAAGIMKEFIDPQAAKLVRDVGVCKE